MPGFDRPARPVVPPHHRAVEGSLRPLASHLVKAIPAARAIVVPAFHETAGIEIGAPLALVVDDVAVRKQRALMGVQRRHPAVSQPIDQQRGGVGGVVRTAAHVHQIQVRDGFPYADRAGGVRRRPLRAAIERTGADGDYRRGIPANLLRDIQSRAAADRAISGVAGGNRTFHDRQVFAGVLMHHAIQNGVGLLAGRRHDGLVIFPREKREHQLSNRWMARAQHRFRVAGAILQLQPYQHRPALLFQGCRNLCRRARGQTQHGCHRPAKLQKFSSWDSIAPQGVRNARLATRHQVSPIADWRRDGRQVGYPVRSHRDERALLVPCRAPNNASL